MKLKRMVLAALVPAKWAVAAGSAACTMPEGAPPSPEAVLKLVVG